MSIKSRLIFSFSMMVLLTLMLGAVLIAAFWILRERYVEFEHQRKVFDIAMQLKQTFEQERRSLDGYLLGLDAEHDRLAVLASEMEEHLRHWGKIAQSPKEKEEIEKLSERMRALKPDLDQVVRLVTSGHRTSAIRIMESALLPVMETLEREIRMMALQKRNLVDQSWEAAKRLASRTTKFIVLLLIAVVFAGSGFAILIYQSVAQPLAKLREGTLKIAQGEWDLKLDLQGPTELAELARCFEDMAQSLAGLQLQVVQMDRMSSMGTLAGGVAHEINNPLTGVLGQAQFLLERLRPDDPLRSNVEKIERAAKRCRKIVRGLLDFSRPQDYFFQAVDVEHALDSVLSLCETEVAATGIQVQWQRNPLLPKAWASENHLQQVFLNVVTNAMHAMPKGGTLTIDVAPRGLGQPAPRNGSGNGETADLFRKDGNPSDDSWVEVRISDTGAGIRKEHLSHLFDPFFTTKEPGHGTGLGLSISYGIIQKHHGQIEAHSEGPGTGSIFIIRIPVAPVDFEPEKPGLTQDSGSAGGLT